MVFWISKDQHLKGSIPSTLQFWNFSPDFSFSFSRCVVLEVQPPYPQVGVSQENPQHHSSLVGGFQLQPIWKILVKVDHFPPGRGETLKKIETTTQITSKSMDQELFSSHASERLKSKSGVHADLGLACSTSPVHLIQTYPPKQKTKESTIVATLFSTGLEHLP